MACSPEKGLRLNESNSGPLGHELTDGPPFGPEKYFNFDDCLTIGFTSDH